jgi:hypothetical protein
MIDGTAFGTQMMAAFSYFDLSTLYLLNELFGLVFDPCNSIVARLGRDALLPSSASHFQSYLHWLSNCPVSPMFDPSDVVIPR